MPVKLKDPHVDLDGCPPHLVPLHDIWISTSERAMELNRKGHDVLSAEVNSIADDIERVYFQLRKVKKYNRPPVKATPPATPKQL